MKRRPIPISSLPAWSKLNDINFYDVRVQTLDASGHGLAAERALSSANTYDQPRLLSVPKDLILSNEAVEEYAKVDGDFRELLHVAGGKSTRGDVMLFLIMQLTIVGLDGGHLVGVSNPWTEYVRLLPDAVPVPTTWTESQRELLIGTSLESALDAKSAALTREFEELRERSIDLTWCVRAWWEKESLSLDDWVLVDSWYRSRNLELPQSGESMVPCLDMANHSAEANAYYEQTSTGDVVLLLRPDKELSKDDEITISYGSEKSAAEMLFSYGFIDPRTTTTSLILPIHPFSDDPLAKAKVACFPSRPIMRISTDAFSDVSWSSPFIHLMSLNEEDGLAFRMLQQTDGARSSLRTLWQGRDVSDATHRFDELVRDHPLRDVFSLRAVALLEARVHEQLQRLHTSDELLEPTGADDDGLYASAMLLRRLETQVLERVSQLLHAQNTDLLARPSVVEYLASMNADQHVDPAAAAAAAAATDLTTRTDDAENDAQDDFS
ncbi:MAG: hypothetical protein M1818_004170 [Claussenomyces sp. TS43310]|nr:MAG: hypothetical protein M1818_004170 [Claussenomyces sp. TS43310]